MSSKKGFVFTVDAFVALTLVVLVIFVIVYQLNIPSAFFSQQTQTYNYARDVVSTLGTMTIGELKANGQAPTAMSQYATSTLEDEHTVLEEIALEAVSNAPQAELIAKELLISGNTPLIPEQFGISITVNGQEIKVREKQFTKIQSSASYVLMGYTTSRNPGAPRYDYPAYAPESEKYCSDGISDGIPGDSNNNQPAVPCTVYFPDSSYTPGVITETPTIVRVSVWT